jgi:hypothetical protein
VAFALHLSTGNQLLIRASGAINALVEIMRDHEMSPRRRIEACEHLLDYECPPEIIEEAKGVLMAIAGSHSANIAPSAERVRNQFH